MKRFLMALCLVMATFALGSCEKQEPEAYRGERTLDNTVWGVYEDDSGKITKYVMFFSYDEGCGVNIPGSDEANVHYDARYTFDTSTHAISITPLKDLERAPKEITGGVDASGMTLSWYFGLEGDPDYRTVTEEFTYICPADELEI